MAPREASQRRFIGRRSHLHRRGDGPGGVLADQTLRDDDGAHSFGNILYRFRHQVSLSVRRIQLAPVIAPSLDLCAGWDAGAGWFDSIDFAQKQASNFFFGEIGSTSKALVQNR